MAYRKRIRNKLNNKYTYKEALQLEILEFLYEAPMEYYRTRLKKIIIQNAQSLGIGLGSMGIQVKGIRATYLQGDYNITYLPVCKSLEEEALTVVTEWKKLQEERSKVAWVSAYILSSYREPEELKELLGDTLYSRLSIKEFMKPKIYRNMTLEEFKNTHSTVLKLMKERVVNNILMADVYGEVKREEV